MIRHLLLACCLFGLVHGEEPSIAEFLPDLSAPEFKTRQATMEKIQVFAKKNPESFLKEIPPLLKKTKDPEIHLRLREVAMGLKFKTTKSLFGFTFLLNRASKFENQIVSGVVLIDVVDGHPAKRDGLKARDIILALNGKPFARNLPEEEIRKIFASQAPGKKVALMVQRHGETLDIEVSPMEVDVDQDIKEKLLLDFDDWLREQTKD